MKRKVPCIDEEPIIQRQSREIADLKAQIEELKNQLNASMASP